MSSQAKTIEEFTSGEYKHGFVTEIEEESIPKGLSEDVIRLISAKKDEPEFLLDWRLKAYRNWLTMTEPSWANVHYPPIDYQDDRLLLGAEAKTDGPKSLDEVDPEAPRDVREAGHPAPGAEDARRGRRRRGLRQRFGRDDVQGEARRARHHLLLLLRGGAEASRAGPEVPRLGRPLHRQLLRGAELRGLHRRLVRLRPEGRASARWSCRPTSASTRRTRGSSSAR